MIKKIGIVTSGGDAPGMNAAISAVTRKAISNGIEVVGILDAYKGVCESNFVPFGTKEVEGIINRGGTILGTVRMPEFSDMKLVQLGADKLKEAGIEALVVIGGDGTFRGGNDLTKVGVNCIGIPATIDNDIKKTDRTIGYDTALNTCVEAIEKIKDTTISHHRCMIVEVMGNKSGYLAINTGIATGADIIIAPETGYDEDKVIEKVLELKKAGKEYVLIVACEKFFSIPDLAKAIAEKTEYDTRYTVLGHIQRGGSPTASDRVLATRFGEKAVSLLMEGKGGLTVTYKNGEIIALPIDEVVNAERDISEHLELMRTFNELSK